MVCDDGFMVSIKKYAFQDLEPGVEIFDAQVKNLEGMPRLSRGQNDER